MIRRLQARPKGTTDDVGARGAERHTLSELARQVVAAEWADYRGKPGGDAAATF